MLNFILFNQITVCVRMLRRKLPPNKELQQEAVIAKQECELVIREVLYPSPGVNVTSIRENFLQLSLGPEVAFVVCLLPSSSGQGDLKDNDHSIEPDLEMRNRDLKRHVDSVFCEEPNGIMRKKDVAYVSKLPLSKKRLPNRLSLLVYFEQIFH
jgi:hypothetical protein